MNAAELVEGQVVRFAGGWCARISEKIRSDVVFVEAITEAPYRHHAFGLKHPIWHTAELVTTEEDSTRHQHDS